MKLQIGIIIAFALLVNVYTFIKDLSSNYKKQITKYNSTLDYVEKK